MPPRARPNAFEVSFGEEAAPPNQSTSLRDPHRNQYSISPFSRSTQDHRSSPSTPSSSRAGHPVQAAKDERSPRPESIAKADKGRVRPHSSVSMRPPVSSKPAPRPASAAEKRKPEASGSQPGKRRRVVEIPDDVFTRETEDTVILGEDPAEEYSEDDKPIRLLTDFSIIDPDGEYVTLTDLPYANGFGGRRRCEAIGNVSPVYEEEDAGQDDDYVDGNKDTERESQKLRTTAILQYTINYAEADSPVYILTAHAWYMLSGPSERYKQEYLESYRRHRMAQLVISRAFDEPEETYQKFQDDFLKSYDELAGVHIKAQHLQDCALLVLNALGDPAYDRVSNSPLIKGLLSDAGLSVRPPSPQQARRPPAVRLPPSISTRACINNIDLRVLRPENQNRTYVTPLISQLAKGLFREKVRVAGHTRAERPLTVGMKNLVYKRLTECLRLAHDQKKSLGFDGADRLYGEYWKAVTIGRLKEKICVGDIVLVTAGAYPGRENWRIPDVIDGKTIPGTLADYFWFARIIWINQRTKSAHVQWLEHASKTLLQEIHDPQELFMVEICDKIDLQLIVGKVTVFDWSRSRREERDLARKQLHYMSFFYCQAYDQATGTFHALDLKESPIKKPPDNCAICLRAQDRDAQNYGRHLKTTDGKIVGVAYHGVRYHINDFALIKSSSPLCTVGQIFSIPPGSRSCSLIVRVLGRICDILHVIPDELKDERHFFLTDMYMTVDVSDIIGPCRVMNANEYPASNLASWLSSSTNHFFVRYHFPNLEVQSLDQRTVLEGRNAKLIQICKPCYDEDQANDRLHQEWLTSHPDSLRLRTFDPFGGVGAFALSMQQAGCLELTHAVEISPSAAKTLKENSPKTVVYNECANRVLEYAYKHFKHKRDSAFPAPQPLKEIEGDRYLPAPPQPKDIDCIVAGFPCQPHSRLNMFQKAHDRKSNLILNLLSWVDFLRPKYCFFENVRGFLKSNLNAVQVDEYRVKGGIEMGGLKLVVRAMIAMGYQVRFGLLQAAHFGTPQARVRFFLVAARLGYTLPELPQPLYHFPLKDSLVIKFPHGLTVKPINTESGVLPFNFVSVDDAISDLPRFDWRNPKNPNERTRRDPETQEVIVAVARDRGNPYCGPPRPRYRHTPRTLFQQRARQPKPEAGEDDDNDINDARNIQHFTRILKDDVVARVVHIPLKPKADYRSLFATEFRDLWEWQMSDPKSATARHGYRPGMYGRLDKNGWFQTTVTNVEPTAKQSWVLNPYCKRVVTVRELARSQGFPDHFKFHCVTNDVVKTMHREIGNAVPWPVGQALGRQLRKAMFEHWLEHQRDEENVIE